MSAKEFVTLGKNKSELGIEGYRIEKTHITNIIPPYAAKDAAKGLYTVPTDFLKNEETVKSRQTFSSTKKTFLDDMIKEK